MTKMAESRKRGGLPSAYFVGAPTCLWRRAMTAQIGPNQLFTSRSLDFCSSQGFKSSVLVRVSIVEMRQIVLSDFQGLNRSGIIGNDQIHSVWGLGRSETDSEVQKPKCPLLSSMAWCAEETNSVVALSRSV
jgi:hypothetical protein